MPLGLRNISQELVYIANLNAFNSRGPPGFIVYVGNDAAKDDGTSATSNRCGIWVMNR